MITIPAQSVPHHIAHGDGLVGDEVPGSPGSVFDETCSPVPAATETTYAIAGVFDRSNEPLLPVGTQYRATLTFDASSLLAAAAPLGGVRYQPAFFSFRAGAVEFSGAVTIDIDSSHDWIRIDGYPMLGTLSASIRINLTGSGLASDDFPDPFPTLSAFAGVTQLVVNTACCTNTASITTFGPIP